MKTLSIFFAADSAKRDTKVEKYGKVKYSLNYVPNTEETDKSLVHITDIEKYKNQLYIYPVNHTTL